MKEHWSGESWAKKVSKKPIVSSRIWYVTQAWGEIAEGKHRMKGDEAASFQGLLHG